MTINKKKTSNKVASQAISALTVKNASKTVKSLAGSVLPQINKGRR